MPPAQRVEGRSAEEIRTSIEGFLANCRQPALLEPGEELLALETGNFALGFRGSRLTIEAWDCKRNLVRRISSIRRESAARLELVVERFGRKEGPLFLLDLGRPAGVESGRRSERLVFRERFGTFLRRQFPGWKLTELSAEANLEFSLSPAFPRAFLRHGQHGWAAIACPPDGDEGATLSFGLIWLSYLRARERRVAINGLAIYLPAGHEQAAALRLLCLDPSAATFALFSYTPEDQVAQEDPRDHGNLDTRLEPCRRLLPDDSEGNAWWRELLSLPGVEAVSKPGGASLRVRGLEFAAFSGKDLLFGMGERVPAREPHLSEIQILAAQLDALRSPRAADRVHPLYRRFPEAWLESQVRQELEVVDATLLKEPIYGQVPAFAGGERGILDLLAVDRSGRLTILELKASADLHLPMQALDYWIRVKWHLDRGEFTAAGYFPGVTLRSDPPRVLLVSPSLEFHPSTETLLAYYSPIIEVERVGLGVEWRRGLEVMFRLTGAQRPR
jgi:hypothetical protein